MSDPVGGRPSGRRQLWDERHAARDPIESHEPDPTLIYEAGRLQPGRALDLGTGDGRNAVWLAGRGWRVTAVDFSRVALDRGRALAEVRGLDIDWQLADLLNWSSPKRRFDLVGLFFVHLPPEERRQVYRRAASAVAPGGTLLIVGHDRTNLIDGVGGPQDPALLFSPGEVAAELSGFRVERAEAVRRGRPGGGGPIDAVVRAVRRSA